ncbi:ROK family transcriptional regulator [Cryptosporangium sp. NPDC048952]|uniref:ROK family transcriptional regulator n=1 Tax=Cryptosporangium sp. NPDC048952 TaxID=3363961 RepID=UPI003712FE09
MTTRSAQLLRIVHARPGVTRAEAARLIGVGTGAATELVGRLGAAGLVHEQPAAPSGARGRPTTALVPHPEGPLVAAVSITHEAWQVAAVELGGRVVSSTLGSHRGGDPSVVLGAVRGAVDALGPRVRGVGVAVTGPVSRDQRVEAVGLGWHALDLSPLRAGAAVFVVGNDAMLAGAAESRRGAAAGAAVALHVRVAAGIGGAIVADGRVVTGAIGAAGEFGHLPFGEPGRSCSCGASGCWGNEVDGTALARLLGAPRPPDPIAYARRVIAAARAAGGGSAGADLASADLAGADLAGADSAGADSAGADLAGADLAGAGAERVAVEEVAGALGRGIAGLVNGLDPDLVTVGGLGVEILAAAPDTVHTAYLAGLMRFRRAAAPPLVAATLGDDGPIVGAAEEAWNVLLEAL